MKNNVVLTAFTLVTLHFLHGKLSIDVCQGNILQVCNSQVTKAAQFVKQVNIKTSVT